MNNTEKAIQLPFYEPDPDEKPRESRQILLIVNPVSGRMKSKTGLFEILDELYRTASGEQPPIIGLCRIGVVLHNLGNIKRTGYSFRTMPQEIENTNLLLCRIRLRQHFILLIQ